MIPNGRDVTVEVITHAANHEEDGDSKGVRFADKTSTKCSGDRIRADDTRPKDQSIRSTPPSRESSLSEISPVTERKSGRSLSLTEERIMYSKNLRKAAASAFGKT